MGNLDEKAENNELIVQQLNPCTKLGSPFKTVIQ